jgi:hypothetical protein
MQHATQELPDEGQDAVSRQPSTGREHGKSALKRNAPPSRVTCITSRTQATLLGYLLVVLVLGTIALLRAPEADVSQVIVSLNDWIRFP